MNLRKQTERICTVCSKKYLAGSNSVMCPDCSYEKAKQRANERQKKARKLKRQLQKQL